MQRTKSPHRTCGVFYSQACFEISGTSWTNSGVRLQTAHAPSARSFQHNQGRHLAAFRISRKLCCSSPCSPYSFFFFFCYTYIENIYAYIVVNDGRSYIAGGRETKDQILTRAGRRCRGQSREITAGVGCGEENQGSSKHVCFRGLFAARPSSDGAQKKKKYASSSGRLFSPFFLSWAVFQRELMRRRRHAEL